jgi:hypothetical protein
MDQGASTAVPSPSPSDVVPAPVLPDAMVAPVPELTPAERSARRMRQGVRDMVISLAVVIVVVMLIAMPWRTPTTVQQVVDWQPVASAFGSSVTWPVLVPKALPADWRATSARITPTVDGLTALHVGWLTADQQYAALEQSDTADVSYVSESSDAGSPVATGPTTVVLSGRSWQRLVSGDGTTRSLVHVAAVGTGKVTYVVTGSAQWLELDALASSLHRI